MIRDQSSTVISIGFDGSPAGGLLYTTTACVAAGSMSAGIVTSSAADETNFGANDCLPIWTTHP
jgi:hypothetical protein